MTERVYLGGVTNTTLHIETDGVMHVEEKQDVEGILHYAHAAREYRFDAHSCEGMLRHEAEIPFTVYQEECRIRGVVPFGAESDMVVAAILADPKYAGFRAAPKIRDPRIIMKGAR